MSPAATTARHQLAAPALADVRAAVRRSGGADEAALWQELCASAEVPAGATELPLDRLEVLIRAVASSPGALGAVGHALSVRLRTYRTLAMLGSIED